MKRLSVLLPILILAAASAHAGIASNFSELREELIFRRGVLSNSTDKVEKKQDKACLKGITTIGKITAVTGDIKASFKLGALLQKAFPNEFEPVVTGGVTFTNNLLSLVLTGYQNIGNRLNDFIEEYQLSINSMPASKDRDKAQAALDTALTALNNAEDAFISGDYKTTTKLFGVCVKALTKSQKSIAKVSF